MSPNKFNCEICGKKLSTKKGLEYHIDCVHLNVKKFKCHICEKSYGKIIYLNQHIKTVHINIKDSKCDICKKNLWTKKWFDQTHQDSSWGYKRF